MRQEESWPEPGRVTATGVSKTTQEVLALALARSVFCKSDASTFNSLTVSARPFLAPAPLAPPTSRCPTGKPPPRLRLRRRDESTPQDSLAAAKTPFLLQSASEFGGRPRCAVNPPPLARQLPRSHTMHQRRYSLRVKGTPLIACGAFRTANLKVASGRNCARTASRLRGIETGRLGKLRDGWTPSGGAVVPSWECDGCSLTQMYVCTGSLRSASITRSSAS